MPGQHACLGAHVRVHACVGIVTVRLCMSMHTRAMRVRCTIRKRVPTHLGRSGHFVRGNRARRSIVHHFVAVGSCALFPRGYVAAQRRVHTWDRGEPDPRCAHALHALFRLFPRFFLQNENMAVFAATQSLEYQPSCWMRPRRNPVHERRGTAGSMLNTL